MQGRRYLIIGDGAAGTTAAQEIRRRDPNAAILVISDDPHPAYFRAALTNYLLGELREEQVWAVPPTFYSEYAVERRLARIAGIDAARGQAWLASGGAPIAYDALLVASGARARPPSFEGSSLPGVATLRTLQDARWILDQIKLGGVRRALVVGGGPLALEWALALRERGVVVTMLVREARLMVGALDDVGSDLLVARLRQSGLDVRMHDEIHAAMPGRDGRVERVVTKSGQTIDCRMVGVAIGVVCNTDFLANSGVSLGARGGIVVNDRMRASVDRVFAAGDVAELGGRVVQLWEPARLQALIAARNMTGSDHAYAPGALYFATRLHDLDFASVGDVGKSEGAQELVDHPLRTGRIAYRKVVLRQGRVIGALMLGDRDERVRQRGKLFKRLIDTAIDVSGVARDLLDPAFDLKAWLETKRLVEKPVATRAVAVPIASPAALRGTQAVRLDQLGLAPGRGGASPAVASPLAATGGAPPDGDGPMLSIGFRIPAAAAAVVSSAAAAAYLEGAGRRWEITGGVTSIGRDPSGQVALVDVAASFVHAQITPHGAHHYLRDVGSANGTWVNGQLVIVPHRLRDGDIVRIGATELAFRRPGAQPSGGAPAQVSQPKPTNLIPSLDVRTGPCIGLCFALKGPTVTLGRDPMSTIRLDDIAVSRRHAVLSEHQGGWLLSDLHSSRGTFKNGARIAPGHDVPLQDGDQIQLGDSLLVFARRPAR